MNNLGDAEVGAAVVLSVPAPFHQCSVLYQCKPCLFTATRVLMPGFPAGLGLCQQPEPAEQHGVAAVSGCRRPRAVQE
jgi:hypothetical protein